MVKPKLQFYEVVRVLPACAGLLEIHGETGAILGISEQGEPEYEYGVFIEREGQVWSVPESSLVSTGIIKQRADFYDDKTVVKVSVDNNGYGAISDNR